MGKIQKNAARPDRILGLSGRVSLAGSDWILGRPIPCAEIPVAVVVERKIRVA